MAIAIYFAILRLRPSPFCILDEIDAALDEGNVRRYAQYLQNFTDTTQFILVTHRRSAMEEASVLLRCHHAGGRYFPSAANGTGRTRENGIRQYRTKSALYGDVYAFKERIGVRWAYSEEK